MTTTESLTVQDSTSPARSKRPWCLFQSGQSAYAVSLESVAEVVEVERLVRVPLAPPRIVGLCTLRREVIPVVELSETVINPSTNILSSKTIILLLRTTRGTWGVRVNAEGTMVTEEPLDELATLENVHAHAINTRPTMLKRGIVLYKVIDPEATWQNVRGSVESWYEANQGLDRASDFPAPSSSI